MTVAHQIVLKPNTGADISEIVALAKESAAIWRRHGATVSFWTVTTGEMGNFVFAVRFDSYAAYGAAMDKVVADPAMMAWQTKRMKSGLTTWVRSNLVRDIEI